MEYFARDYERAIGILREVLDREPSFSLAHYYMAMSLGQLRRIDEALSHLQQARGNTSKLETDHAWLRALAGDTAPAEALMHSRRQDVSKGKAKPTVLVLPAIAAGHNQLALSSLEAMWATREIELLHVKVSPRFDALRTDPQFAALVQRVWPQRASDGLTAPINSRRNNPNN